MRKKLKITLQIEEIKYLMNTICPLASLYIYDLVCELCTTLNTKKST